ncbi:MULTISPECIES: hypothetical protein [unclassified Nostoc]|nr:MULTISPECIES: hypothetical protein [unclassified Nostoc]
MKIGTKVIRAGLAPTVQGEPLLAGVTLHPLEQRRDSDVREK